MIFEKKILSIYNHRLLRRRDPDGNAYQLRREDFPGLLSKELSFTGDRGQQLFAYIYYRTEVRRDRLIMLDHGMGCGHSSYLAEIDALTRRGYTVFTYDHTGTDRSGGDNIGGFSQSLSDLDRAVRFVRSLDDFKNSRIAVIGHSWGGFSTMNIAALYPDITHVVAISGFVSPRMIQHQALGGVLRLYRPMLYDLEKSTLPDYADFDGRESLSRAVDTRALIIHSQDDRTCLFKKHFLVLEKALKDNERVKFIAVDNKNHHPQYTEDAVSYKRAYVKELKAKLKHGELSTEGEKAAFVASYDWLRMYRQDEQFWDMVKDFLDK